MRRATRRPSGLSISSFCILLLDIEPPPAAPNAEAYTCGCCDSNPPAWADCGLWISDCPLDSVASAAGADPCGTNPRASADCGLRITDEGYSGGSSLLVLRPVGPPFLAQGEAKRALGKRGSRNQPRRGVLTNNKAPLRGSHRASPPAQGSLRSPWAKKDAAPRLNAETQPMLLESTE